MRKIIAQTVLPFKLENSNKENDLTSFAGLPLIHELKNRQTERNLG